jgi:transposase
LAFEGILHVLKTGIQWKALPKDVFGSPSAVNSYFLKWQKAGLFLSIWKAGLAEHNDLEGIAWEWRGPERIWQPIVTRRKRGKT